MDDFCTPCRRGYYDNTYSRDSCVFCGYGMNTSSESSNLEEDCCKKYNILLQNAFITFTIHRHRISNEGFEMNLMRAVLLLFCVSSEIFFPNPENLLDFQTSLSSMIVMSNLVSCTLTDCDMGFGYNGTSDTCYECPPNTFKNLLSNTECIACTSVDPNSVNMDTGSTGSEACSKLVQFFIMINHFFKKIFQCHCY